jgi:sec-independent protein translocase protein TatA
MPDLGVPELLIIAFIVVLLFGPGKAADLGSSLGKGIREFRKASQEVGEAPSPPPQPQLSPPAPAAAASACTSCGAATAIRQRFCTNCGAPVAAAV